MSKYSKSVKVKFTLDRDTWQRVVEDSCEKMFVDDEGSDTFVVEYESQAEFDRALSRFEGMIEYEAVE